MAYISLSKLAKWEHLLKKYGSKAGTVFPCLMDQTLGGKSLGLPPIQVNSSGQLQFMQGQMDKLNRGAPPSCQFGFTQAQPG